MNCRKRAVFWCITILGAVSLATVAQAQTNPFTKAQVGDRIRKVEDGVDQFQKYLENRGQDTKNRADSAQSSGTTTRRQRSDSANTDARTLPRPIHRQYYISPTREGTNAGKPTPNSVTLPQSTTSRTQ